MNKGLKHVASGLGMILDILTVLFFVLGFVLAARMLELRQLRRHVQKTTKASALTTALFKPARTGARPFAPPVK